MGSQPSEAVLLEARVSELGGYFLELKCRCGYSGQYSLKPMAEQRAGNYQLKTFLDRLRCKRCDAAPQSIALLETIETDEAKQPRGWRIPLAIAS